MWLKPQSTYCLTASTASAGSLVTIQRLAISSSEKLVGEPLHLERVVDAVLLLGAQRQRGPEAHVVQRLVGVAVVGELDLDHPVDVVAGAPRLLQALVDGGQQLVLVELAALARRCR